MLTPDGGIDAKAVSDPTDKMARDKKKDAARKPVLHSLAEGAKPANLRVHVRGNPATLGEEAPRRFLAVLSDDDPSLFTRGSGRLELARAIASEDNPLTARVIVNRVWLHHFGRGIVGTPSNFGTLGERPTHPELLDYLAARFVAGGWSIKALHREIMLSATYRLGSRHDGRNATADPDNRLLWRMNRRRLEVEPWRDAMLAVAGNLDRTVGGPSADLSSPANRRRTLYGAVSRHNLDPLLRLFDFPDPNLTSDRRPVTSVPLQQLFVLNSPFMARQAKALAARVTAAEPDDAGPHPPGLPARVRPAADRPGGAARDGVPDRRRVGRLGEVRPGAAECQRVRVRGLTPDPETAAVTPHLTVRPRSPAARCSAGSAAGSAPLGLAGVLAGDAAGAPTARSRPKTGHHPAKVKRVIFLFMNGGPSHVDTFDPKPALEKFDGKDPPLRRPAPQGQADEVPVRLPEGTAGAASR